VTGRADDRTPWGTILTPPDPRRPHGRVIVLAVRPYRSRITTLTCFCKRRRKDGTCLTLDGVIPILKHPERVRLKHPELDQRVDRVPPEAVRRPPKPREETDPCSAAT
jgi:hypothetical protein